MEHAFAPSEEAASDVLDLFLEPVAAWFRRRFGKPSPPQRLGWPVVARNESTLLIAPTGSGKTLAAFLACLDNLWRNPLRRGERKVRVLYISPLKALNTDIARNLEEPLAGIQETAEALSEPLQPLSVAIRTGDTTAVERQRQVRKPPDILITTPESLNLLLTSRARQTLRSVQYVIVDEIHAVCGNKRGVFLSLLLERLEAICPASFVRIGLSATQRPLEEVARYLGGRRRASGQGPHAQYEPRSVTIVDAGQRKDLELSVGMPGGVPALGGSVWPGIEQQVFNDITRHRSTIVFANNRRTVERLAAAINTLASEQQSKAPLARPHHGSLSLDARMQTEAALKLGELRCVVATASLELGIDMGAVELVCQVESPGGVARALQRVGRAGHLVGQTSRGRIYAKTALDLLEAAALARAMSLGEVERLRVPANCLDVLAQQVVSCVAVDRWTTGELFDLVRGAYPYRDLTAAAFESVLRMVSGRFAAETFRDLRPRISWDLIHNTLHPLPGTAQLALVNGGTIPDTGHYPLYLGADGPRLGELDEEFVHERRAGDTFRLGHGTWRITAIEPDRVIVAPAAGESALMPFWRGEQAGRTPELGEAVGTLTREIVEKLTDSRDAAEALLRQECRLDTPAAQFLVQHVARQHEMSGAAPDDRTILIEAFTDPTGEMGLAVLCPLGSKINHALKIIIQALVRARFGIAAATMHSDDGVLIRLPSMDQLPLDILDGVDGNEAAQLLREELGETALFGLRFRQNAGRALLMPRPDPGKRTPLWLQRLRARDLLQTVRRFPEFPIVVETYRECLDDDIPLDRVRALFDAIRDGRLLIVKRSGVRSSPFVSELVLQFTMKYMYEWDEPQHGERRGPVVDDQLLDGVLVGDEATALDAVAVSRLEQSLRGVGRPPRSVEEMAEWLRRVGDLKPRELEGPMAAFAGELESQGRAIGLRLSDANDPERWISAEDAELYHRAFGEDVADVARREALAAILRRYLRTRVLVGLDEVLDRYPIDAPMARELLELIVDDEQFVRVGDNGDTHWADRRNLGDARRMTLAARRREVVAVAPEVFADFVLRLHHVHPASRVGEESGLEDVLTQLEGAAAPLEAWLGDLLPRRIERFRPAWLDVALKTGAWLAQANAIGDVAFVRDDFPGVLTDATEPLPLDGRAARVFGFLRDRGLCFVEEISRGVGEAPSDVRSSLRVLLARGLAVADRVDAYRSGDSGMERALSEARGSRVVSQGRMPRRGREAVPQERWRASPARALSTLLGDSREEALSAWCSILLERYGVLCREVVELESLAPRWRELIDVLSRAEMRGELRRGYFVEGLSGLQFARPQTAESLARHAPSLAERLDAPQPTFISATDPANLYGSNAPFDIPLLDGGTARLARVASSYLVIVAGRPVLIVEAHGKRLTGLASASESELGAACGVLSSLCHSKRPILQVETYNGASVLASSIVPFLEQAGFVHDYPGMAYYARW